MKICIREDFIIDLDAFAPIVKHGEDKIKFHYKNYDNCYTITFKDASERDEDFLFIQRKLGLVSGPMQPNPVPQPKDSTPPVPIWAGTKYL